MKLGHEQSILAAAATMLVDQQTFCSTLMVALLWSIPAGGGRVCCGEVVPTDEAGRAAPFVGDNEVYETAVTKRFDLLSGADVCAASFLLCSSDAANVL